MAKIDTTLTKVDFRTRWGLVEVWDERVDPPVLMRSWKISAEEVEAVNSGKIQPPGATKEELRDYFVAVTGKALEPGMCCRDEDGHLWVCAEEIAEADRVSTRLEVVSRDQWQTVSGKIQVDKAVTAMSKFRAKAVKT